MAKKLIVLSDGTGNSAAKLFKTNVWKLYEALDLTPSSDQIAAYDDGVGTSRFKPWALLTGAFGFGLKRNVLKMYVFLSRHYHNEIEAQQRTKREGGEQQDPKAMPTPPEIYGFGFSRGAFTIRVLAGLVIRQGLVPHASESEMARMALLSYRAYRKDCFKTKTGIEAPFRSIRDAIAKLLDRLHGRPEYDPTRKTQNGLPPSDAARINTGGVKIRFLGVWDTVAAYGMPIEELRVAIDKLIFPLTFTNTELLGQVRSARHALAIDEERSSFTPVLWDFDRTKEDLKQVWFAGVHTNVGGGYPDDSQSSAPLAWMVFEAKAEGLQFHELALNQIRARTTPFGKMYDSRAGFGAFYRYQPRRIRYDPAVGDIPVVHESVVFRMATGFQGYAPIALPQQVKVVDKYGQVYQFAGFQTAAASRLRRSEEAAKEADADEYQQLAQMVASLKPPTGDEVELIRASILRRRIAYFATLISTLALLTFPLLSRALPAPKPSFITEDWIGPLSDIYERIDSLAPSYVQPWLDAIARNPIIAAILALIAIVSYWRGKSLMATIIDRSQLAWNIGKTRPSQAQPSFLDRLALRLLASSAANTSWRFASWKAFPAIVLFVAAILVVTVFDRTAFWLQSSAGGICASADKGEGLPLVQATQEVRVFRTAEPCMATGLRLSKDHRYEISMQIPDDAPWKDGELAADLAGVRNLSWPRALMMSAGVPLRRHLGAPWFVPIARVGRFGSDEHVLSPSDVESTAQPRKVLTSVIGPRRGGELFLFVNDAYSGLIPLQWLRSTMSKDYAQARHFYGNNGGTATVTVRRLTNEVP